jgi:hypothetical protein
MASYATYCEDQAADCARRARLAKSSEVAAYCRSLELRWMRLAEQHKSSTRAAQETSTPSWTHDAPLWHATPRRLAAKARPSDVRLLAKVYSSLTA